MISSPVAYPPCTCRTHSLTFLNQLALQDPATISMQLARKPPEDLNSSDFKDGATLPVSGLHAAIGQLAGDAALQQQLQSMLCMPCSSTEELLTRLQDTVMQHAMQQLQSVGQVESGLLQLSNLLAGACSEFAACSLQQQQQQHVSPLQQPLLDPLQPQQVHQLHLPQQQEQLQCYSTHSDNAAATNSLFRVSPNTNPEHSCRAAAAAVAAAAVQIQEELSWSSSTESLQPLGGVIEPAAAAAAVSAPLPTAYMMQST
jgi:hypothetical protein